MKYNPDPKSMTHDLQNPVRHINFDDKFASFFEKKGVNPTLELQKKYLEWRDKNEETFMADFETYCHTILNYAFNRLDSELSQFKNGKQGENYYHKFICPSYIKYYRFVDLENSGLRWNIDDQNICTISGIPKVAGDINVSIEFILASWMGSFGKQSRTFTLRILADPRTLWQHKPTDPKIEYYKPDTDMREIKNSSCLMLGASQRGRSHAHVGSPRDDDFRLAISESGWDIIAVADGAGSAEFSRRGSAIACEKAVEVCESCLIEMPELETIFNAASTNINDPVWLTDIKKRAYQILAQAANEARKALKVEAENRQRDPKQYATTLLLALAKKFYIGWVILSFQVGDGAMGLLLQKDGKFAAELLAEPDEGEYGGQTRFITMADVFQDAHAIMQRVNVKIVPDFDALLLMTDGVSDAKFETLANLQNNDKWKELWKEIEPIAHNAAAPHDLLDWLGFWSRGNHDDRTIAILIPSSRLNAPAQSAHVTGRRSESAENAEFKSQSLERVATKQDVANPHNEGNLPSHRRLPACYPPEKPF